MTQVFLNAAIDIFKGEVGFSCDAIYFRIGHGFSRAAERYRLMFAPNRLWYPPGYIDGVKEYWWNASANKPENREARIYALLLAYEMNRTRDL